MSTKKERCLKEILFIDCCIVNRDTYAVVGEKDYGEKYDPWKEWPPTHLVFYYNERLWRGEEPWGCIRFGKNNFKWSKLVHMDSDSVIIVDNERGVETRIISAKISEREQEIPREILRTVENLKNIHGTIYAVGTGRGVARRDGKNKWTLISKEIQGKMIKDTNVLSLGFDAIDGFEAHKDLYAGGGHSDMWHYDGEHWRVIDLPILKMRIRAIVCAGDGNVYAVGRYGKIVVGREDNWKSVEQDLTTQDFTDAVWYDDRLYVCTERDLYELKDGKLTKTVFNEIQPFSFKSLYVNDGLLMSAGSYSMAIFDGKKWNVIYGEKTIDDTNLILAQKMLNDAEETLDNLEDLTDAVKTLPKK